MIVTSCILWVASVSATAFAEPVPPPGTLSVTPDAPESPEPASTAASNSPCLYLFPLPKGQDASPAVIVCPGGGYTGLAIDYEGYEVAEWLNRNGVAAFVLRYRVSPHRHPLPLEDARWALRWVRAHVEEYGIDPGRVGMLGFSAGGHLVATAATYEELDVEKSAGGRPDFTVLIYPVISMKPPWGHSGCRDNLLGPGADLALVDRLCSEDWVTAATPPAFLVHSSADSVVPSQNSVAYYLALRRAGVPAALHIFEHGEHGYGMGRGDEALAAWTDLCIRWFQQRGILREPFRSPVR